MSAIKPTTYVIIASMNNHTTWSYYLHANPIKSKHMFKQNSIRDLATNKDKVWVALFLTYMDVSLATNFNSNKPKFPSCNNLEDIKPIYFIP